MGDGTKLKVFLSVVSLLATQTKQQSSSYDREIQTRPSGKRFTPYFFDLFSHDFNFGQQTYGIMRLKQQDYQI